MYFCNNKYIHYVFLQTVDCYLSDRRSFDFLCFILKYPDLSVRTALKKIFRKRQIREFSHKYGLKLDDVVTLLLPEQLSDCFIEMLRVVPDKFHPEN